MIDKNIQKGLLTKINDKWFVEYISETAGDNSWHNCIPIYDLEKDSELVADLKLVEKYNTPISELEGLHIKWRYKFNYDYAELI